MASRSSSTFYKKIIYKRAKDGWARAVRRHPFFPRLQHDQRPGRWPTAARLCWRAGKKLTVRARPPAPGKRASRRCACRTRNWSAITLPRTWSIRRPVRFYCRGAGEEITEKIAEDAQRARLQGAAAPRQSTMSTSAHTSAITLHADKNMTREDALFDIYPGDASGRARRPSISAQAMFQSLFFRFPSATTFPRSAASR